MRQTLLSEFSPASRVSMETSSRTVRLPWHPQSGGVGLASDWDVVVAALTQEADHSVEGLRRLLNVLLNRRPVYEGSQTLEFKTLCYVIGHLMSEEERVDFFNVTLPWMKTIVVEGPKRITRQILILSQGVTGLLLLTHAEVVTLLVCGFFSLFPGRSHANIKATSVKARKLQPFNFAHLFCLETTERFESQCAKVQCLMQYFIYCSHHTTVVWPCVEIYRVCRTHFPVFECSQLPMQAAVISEDARIEECFGTLQVDFANRFIGGGVLSAGCLQEEIRFVTCPELLVSLLLCEVLLDNEVVFVSGAGAYSATGGYAKTFHFVGPQSPDTVSTVGSKDVIKFHEEHASFVERFPVAVAGALQSCPCFVRNSCVVAMDAMNFCVDPESQYLKKFVRREVEKAFTAFKGARGSALPLVHSGLIATGNWGCGAFHGDRELKLLLQWCAASQAGRPLIYSAFGDVNLCHNFRRVYEKLKREAWAVGDVFTMILFCCEIVPAPQGKLFECFLTMPWCRGPSPP
uniref:poly(ADP-ribose) glycohydrolase n=1 Tax=Trypanosoma congolense (strain IL3000) TaxID=1068625 RepID=G0UUR1_TRYCI|nr:putative poly(ADP-ribose) glycohydrolase [Trypanosoma congolense IL3000]